MLNLAVHFFCQSVCLHSSLKQAASPTAMRCRVLCTHGTVIDLARPQNEFRS